VPCACWAKKRHFFTCAFNMIWDEHGIRRGSCYRGSQLIAQLKYACDRRRHVRVPIAFGLEKTLLIQLEVEGATLLSRFVCARESSQLPPECASLCARCFNWALATRRAPETRKTKRDVHPSGMRSNGHANNLNSLSLTRRDCARGERPIKRFYCSSCVFMAPRVNCLFAARR